MFDHPDYDGHEELLFFSDPEARLNGIIAVHSTALGPAVGGTRLMPYPSVAAAVTDVLRLSKGMTAKAAVAGLPVGGAKAVLLAPEAFERTALLEAYARVVDRLHGRFVTGEDVGIDESDASVLRRSTPYVAGASVELGGYGDPSPRTASGLVGAMRATCAALDQRRCLRGRRVVVAGVGKVGAALARMLVDEGAEVTVADPNTAAVNALVRSLGGAAHVVDPGEAAATPCDLFAPCALGGVLDDATIPRLACRAVVGSANNQLAHPRCADLLAERGVLYVPDYVANAGGLIQVVGEHLGFSRAEVERRVAAIEQTVDALLAFAAAERITPAAAAADTYAAARVAEARSTPAPRLAAAPRSA
ncbi:MAG: Leu/Phe/Val dehydrogenase [Acidimicrobiales bacterium]